MTKQIHRGLTSALSGLAGLSALLAATDPASLNVDPVTAAWTAVGLSAASIVVTAFRQFFGDDA